MKIIAAESDFPGQWTAVDDDTYDGPGSLIGRGESKDEAINDLKEQIEEKRLMRQDLHHVSNVPGDVLSMLDLGQTDWSDFQLAWNYMASYQRPLIVEGKRREFGKYSVTYWLDTDPPMFIIEEECDG